MYLNFNVGLVGHVDSGKTSLAKVLSNIASTAAFDKSKQSQERGITLDLGFSSFKVPIPPHLQSDDNLESLQFTLVDCPGHAALIKTIIGGAQIVDMFLLVIDITKGIQTQTGECIVIGELTCDKMIVVLNKIDLIPEENRAKSIEKMTKRIKKVLDATCYKDVSFVTVSAKPTDGDPIGIDNLIEEMKNKSYLPVRKKTEPFFMSVDHCFNVSGRGTILTGTILQGQVKVKDDVFFPTLNITKQVKSMQVFREERQKAEAGDRLGLCVSKFDKELIERGIICAPNYAIKSYAAIIPVNKIKHYKFPIVSGSKFHISIGHETCMANVTFFSIETQKINDINTFDKDLEYKYCNELSDEKINESYYAILEFGNKPIFSMPNCLIIASKLDMDIHTSSCRLAFSGHLLLSFSTPSYKTTLTEIKVFKTKRKEGVIDRIVNNTDLIVKNMFHKETKIDIFTNFKVTLSSGEVGVIQGHFGQTGKVKVTVNGGLKEKTIENFNNKKTKSDSNDNFESVKVILEYKKYVFNKDSKLKQ